MSTDKSGGLLPLLVWTSPAFPVGAFAYSHGLEWAVESGRIRDAASLLGWLTDLIDHGAPRNDAILAAAAYRAADADPFSRGAGEGGMRSMPDEGGGEARPCETTGDAGVPATSPIGPSLTRGPPSPAIARPVGRASLRDTLSREKERASPSLFDINELALALSGSRERHLETSQQGNAFVLAARAAWPCAALDRLVDAVSGDRAYPIAFATAAAGHAVPLDMTLEAFTLGVLANLVSAAVRLGVIGQTDGQRVIAALAGPIHGLAAAAATSTLDDLGAAAFASDLASLQHETQYSRLFRS